MSLLNPIPITSIALLGIGIGWTRNIARRAEDSTSMGTDVGLSISASASRAGPAKTGNGRRSQSGNAVAGGAGGNLGFQSSDRGTTSETANANIDIVNYDVREAIAAAERAAARSGNPAHAFSLELSHQVLGPNGLRNRYLEHADSGRGTADVTGPLTSIEQSSLLKSGNFSTDLEHGPQDGDPTFKERRDK